MFNSMSQQLLFNFTMAKVSLTVAEYAGHLNENNPQESFVILFFKHNFISLSWSQKLKNKIEIQSDLRQL